MSADTPLTNVRRASRRTGALFAANAATQFAIQAWLAYGFAKHVWKLAGPLPWLAPVALDVFAINLMGAAYELRRAPLRQRAYVWTWLGVVIGAQVLAAEGFADHENWSWWGRGASVFPSIFLAASLHALIITARRRDEVHSDAAVRVGMWERWRTARRAARELRRERQVARKTPRPVTVNPRPVILEAGRILEARVAEAVAAAEREAAARMERTTAAEQAAGTVPARQRPARPDSPPPPPPPSGKRGRQRSNPTRDLVIKRCCDANPPETAKDVAKDLGIGVRVAQIWVQKERERRAATSRDVTAGAPPGA